MLVIFEGLAILATILVLWSVSGIMVDSVHNICSKFFGNHLV